MITVRLFVIPGQSEATQAIADLNELKNAYPHQLAVVDVSKDPDLMHRYGEISPVLQVGPYLLKTAFTKQEIQVALGAAMDRARQSEQVNEDDWSDRTRRGRTISFGDRVFHWISKHYLALFNVLLALYVGIPFLAPVFMKVGWETPAMVIYKVYSPLCHQFAFRSYFLFGEQPYYPRALAGMKGLVTYEQIAPDPVANINYARTFTGNETLGYKVALCERDVAIYGSLFLFGIVFAIARRKVKKINWLVYALVGLLPIAVDGFSQIPGILATHLPAVFILRESTPLLRTITGVLFGFLTGWLIFPLFEDAMRDTREFLTTKISVAQQLKDQ